LLGHFARRTATRKTTLSTTEKASVINAKTLLLLAVKSVYDYFLYGIWACLLI